MKRSMGMLFAALAVFAAGAVPALAAGVANPSTGDNSMVAVALIVMAITKKKK